VSLMSPISPISVSMRLCAILFVMFIFTANMDAAPQHAVVRITSHGCSGTVIATGAGRSIILTCAHAWERPSEFRKPIVIDAPSPLPHGKVERGVAPKLVAFDLYDGMRRPNGRDLALIEMRAGPLPYVCQVAPPGTLASVCLSVGYDEMRLPMVLERARIIQRPGSPVMSRPNITYTAEIPWHGRSGGPLISERGQLVGVVQGYEMDRYKRPTIGMYASHTAILSFLQENGYRWAVPSNTPQSPLSSPLPVITPRSSPQPLTTPFGTLSPSPFNPRMGVTPSPWGTGGVGLAPVPPARMLGNPPNGHSPSVPWVPGVPRSVGDNCGPLL
jgi:hypothetical protein